MKVIVNADDCGKSSIVDTHIRQLIDSNKISSTSIIVNMDDFIGAKKIYNDYKDLVSFGWHLNLTEGTPLRYSNILLDYGLYIEKEGNLYYNAEQFRHKPLPLFVINEIKTELRLQYEKLRDNGINISHVDSHHHIHTGLGFMFIVPFLYRNYNIKRFRRIRNVSTSKTLLLRNLWAFLNSSICHDLKMTDYFSSAEEYFAHPFVKDSHVIELMCHPGHILYSKEESLLEEICYSDYNLELINYYDL